MIRVLHLIHSTKLGGVEVAASHLRDRMGAVDGGISYRLMALGLSASPRQGVRPHVVGPGLNSPLSLLSVLREIRRFRAGVLVTSLWRSVAVGFIASFVFTRMRWVVWVHNTRYTHPLDRWAHRLAFRRAHVIFCDSRAARDALVPTSRRRHVVIVPPFVPVAQRATTREVQDRCAMVYWGRLAPQKRIDRALDLLALLPEFHFDMYGPDEGVWSSVESRAQRLGLSDRVSWHGPVAPEEIAEIVGGASFFLQVSDFEGLAMSVAEAMSLGLVPVVTPVGEIPEYTRDGENAVHVDPHNLSGAASRVAALSRDAHARDSMARAAADVALPDFPRAFASGVRGALA